MVAGPPNAWGLYDMQGLQSMTLNSNAIAAMICLSMLSTAGQVDGFRSTVLFTIVPDQQALDAPVILQSDTGVMGGGVPLEALPGKTDSNTLKKVFTVEPGALAEVKSSKIQLFAALRDPTNRNNFSFDVWKWIFFELNGHGWGLRVEDLPLYRRSLFGIDWNDMDWVSIRIPDVNYLREGKNELVIWNNNPPEKPKEKYLVVAYDETRQSAHSFSLVREEWVANNLNGGVRVDLVNEVNIAVAGNLRRHQPRATPLVFCLGTFREKI